MQHTWNAIIILKSTMNKKSLKGIQIVRFKVIISRKCAAIHTHTHTEMHIYTYKHTYTHTYKSWYTMLALMREYNRYIVHRLCIARCSRYTSLANVSIAVCIYICCSCIYRCICICSNWLTDWRFVFAFRIWHLV